MIKLRLSSIAYYMPMGAEGIILVSVEASAVAPHRPRIPLET